MYSIQYTVCNVKCITVQRTMYSIQYTVCNVKCIMVTVRYIVYDIHCIVYDIRGIMYVIHYNVRLVRRPRCAKWSDRQSVIALVKLNLFADKYQYVVSGTSLAIQVRSSRHLHQLGTSNGRRPPRNVYPGTLYRLQLHRLQTTQRYLLKWSTRL